MEGVRRVLGVLALILGCFMVLGLIVSIFEGEESSPESNPNNPSVEIYERNEIREGAVKTVNYVLEGDYCYQKFADGMEWTIDATAKDSVLTIAGRLDPGYTFDHASAPFVFNDFTLSPRNRAIANVHEYLRIRADTSDVWHVDPSGTEFMVKWRVPPRAERWLRADRSMISVIVWALEMGEEEASSVGADCITWE